MLYRLKVLCSELDFVHLAFSKTFLLLAFGIVWVNWLTWMGDPGILEGQKALALGLVVQQIWGVISAEENKSLDHMSQTCAGIWWKWVGQKVLRSQTKSCSVPTAHTVPLFYLPLQTC